jgi:uncharacterized protein
MDKEKIIKKIEDNREKIKGFSVKKIGLFGSYVKGEQEKNSDIDILVEFNVTNADNYFNLWDLLGNLFKRVKVDLVIESGLKPEVMYVKEEAEYVKI